MKVDLAVPQELVERFCAALERLAGAMEFQNRSQGFYYSPVSAEPDPGWVDFYDDAAAVALEEKRDAFTERTGLELPEGADPERLALNG